MGFLVDLSTMALFLQIMPPLEARAAAFWCAASATWWINRRLTFRQRQHKAWKKQWAQSLSSALLAFVPNLGVYSGLLILWESIETTVFDAALTSLMPYLLMIPGIAAGMVVNYWLANLWVFKHQDQRETQTP